jgi:DNA primase
MIPQSFIQDLLNRVDIVDLIDRYVKLKRSGANYSACCPFHSEKTPSFTVSQTKQFYHCFGCGAHGTAIGFLIEYSGLGFIDAVKELAQNVGMQVPEERAEKPVHQTSEGESLYDVLLKAAQFYRNELRNAPHAIEYLKNRGLSGDIAKRFGIGYAPAGWQNLARAFPDYNAKSLAAGGLVKTNEDGRRYDVFRDRIIFPIVDVRGHVIGFGGRVLTGGPLTKGGTKPAETDNSEQHEAAGPKYLNSPETPIFEKGRELYGLYQARRAIRDAGRVIVVEGYMDVVGLAQHGIEYAVATLGTATTPLHVQKLLRQSEEIVFCFDGDAAGRRAAWRGLENSLGQLVDGKQVRFLFLPSEHDPDTYVREHGKAAFEEMLGKAVPLSQFLLDELGARVNRATHEGRAKLLQEAKPLIKQITAPMLSLMLRKQLADVAGITQQELDAEFQIKGQPAPAPRYQKREATISQPMRLLMLLLGNWSLCKKVSDERLAMLEASSGYSPVVELIRYARTNDQSSVASFQEAARESPHAAQFEDAASRTLTDAVDFEIADADMESILRSVEDSEVEVEYEQLTTKINKTEEEKARWRHLNRRIAESRGVVVLGGQHENRS